ncbi:hypothetical protein JL100_018075 [Skermanella mucosa]|uniref:hypothetical protein n=1 Tax=Skermanella mucosa TaxID=1789672 RepID=UPI00192B3492|nr:hypothetical protein [Skermanella mucosa]UEM18994.1 hypothetical protein JL100_018075 [Skermanella mucosa]
MTILPIFEKMRARGLCANKSEFCRHWLGARDNAYLASCDNLPTVSRLFRLFVLLRRLPDADDLAREVYALMYRATESGLDGAA